MKSDFSDEASYQSNDSLYVHLPEDLMINNEKNIEIQSSSAVQKLDKLIDFVDKLPICNDKEENIELVDTSRFTVLDDDDDDDNSNITNNEESEQENENIKQNEIEKECKKGEEETIYI